MDYGLLNALGIMVMAVFGLWAFYAAASGKSDRKRRKPDDKTTG
jgi:hypothetical protein